MLFLLKFLLYFINNLFPRVKCQPTGANKIVKLLTLLINSRLTVIFSLIQPRQTIEPVYGGRVSASYLITFSI